MTPEPNSAPGAPIEQLKALAHPLRFRIVQILGSGELNVGEIESASGIKQPALSQQLGVLRKAELVTTRKDAKLVYYSLGLEALRGLAGSIGELAPADVKASAVTRKSSAGSANFARLA